MILELWSSSQHGRPQETIHYRNAGRKALVALCGFSLESVEPRDAVPDDRVCWRVRDNLYRADCDGCIVAAKKPRRRR